MKTTVKCFLVMCGISAAMMVPSAATAGGDDSRNIKKPSVETVAVEYSYPNACKDDITIKLFLAQRSDVKFTLFDLQERAVMRSEEHGCEGENNLTFDLSRAFLPCGQYLLQIEHKYGLQKVMIVKG
jgi:hypothetical protein